MKPNNEITHKNINDFPPEKVAEWNNIKGYDKNVDKLHTLAPQSKRGTKKRRFDRKGGEQR